MPVCVGVLVSQTGALAADGRQWRDGFHLGAMQLDGHFAGLKILPTVIDDQGAPDAALAALTPLLGSLDIVVGPHDGEVADAVAPALAASGVLTVSAVAMPDSAANLFVTGCEAAAQAAACGRAASQDGHLSAFLAATDTRDGRAALAGFRRGFTGNVAGQILLAKDGANLALALAAIDGAGVILACAPGIGFLPACSAAYPMTTLYSVLTDDPPVGSRIATVWIPRPGDPFVAAFAAQWQFAPNALAAEGYDTAFMLDAALRDAGELAGADPLRAALAATNGARLRGRFEFNADRTPRQDILLGEMVGGGVVCRRVIAA